jgi:putative FmdB family regulatory protein
VPAIATIPGDHRKTMPFYEYECDNCKFHTELLQKISDAPLRKCPSCGKNKMRKLVSAPVFRLKGGGWYETDFKSDKEGKRNLAIDKEPDTASESKPAAKATDAKPADSKPADSKPAESKPTESKATESKPAATSSRNRSRAAVSAKAKAVAKSKSRPAAARRKRT